MLTGSAQRWENERGCTLNRTRTIGRRESGAWNSYFRGRTGLRDPQGRPDPHKGEGIMRIAQATPVAITNLWGSVESRVRGAGSIEEAADEFAKGLHLRFEESVALTRVFFTVRFGSLPEERQDFVRALARPSGAVVDLKSTTPVLSLVGSYGDQEDWKDLHKSRGHLGIPLISSAATK